MSTHMTFQGEHKPMLNRLWGFRGFFGMQ